MPELPEVETTCQGITPHIQDQVIQNVVVRQPQLRWKIPSNIKKILNGAKVTNVSRRAKYLLIYTTKANLIIHLGMSGKLCVLEKAQAPQKHDHVDIIFKKGTNEIEWYNCMDYLDLIYELGLFNFITILFRYFYYN